MGKTYPKVPYDVIVKATDGDTESIQAVLKHYAGYIGQLSLRPMKDESGKTHMVVDKELRGRLEINLIRSILTFTIE